MNHECVIGLFYRVEESEFVTADRLKEIIEETKELNFRISTDPLYSKIPNLKIKEWSLAQYCDKRFNTNLHRFKFCPECGKKIDWKQIGRMQND